MPEEKRMLYRERAVVFPIITRKPFLIILSVEMAIGSTVFIAEEDYSRAF